MKRAMRFALLTLLLVAAPAVARIISYAPVTDEFGRPAIQMRDNRHYLLFETPLAMEGPSIFPGPTPSFPSTGNLVLHDALGEDEPRTLFPARYPGYRIEVVAMHETAGGERRILVGTDFDPASGGSSNQLRYLYSPDGGESWQVIDLPFSMRIPGFYRPDVGGKVVRGRGAQVRLGTDATPFVFAAQETQSGTNARVTKMFALDADGSLRHLATFAPLSTAMLIGSDRAGARFLVQGRPETGSGALANGIRILHLDGRLTDVVLTDAVHPYMEGWITSGGNVYLESHQWDQPQKISYLRGSSEEVLLTAGPERGADRPVIFAVPTADYEGAWIVRRAAAQPTALLSHSSTGGLVEEWSDMTAPEVEAIHTAKSGERLLIQVHRPRTMANRIIIDPALAIWNLGSPAPTRYDELFLSEGPAKGFVSLDVDAVANGAPFVFDSAPVEPPPPPEFSSGIGGADIAQEWGIVRASLHQRLVIPALARLRGGYGSFWKTDLVLQNPDSEPLAIQLRFSDSSTRQSSERTLELAPLEMRFVPDALDTLFGLEQGGGALFLTPQPGRHVLATSRTYNDTDSGTYGMGIGANDLHAASSARFFLTFAGAFQGENHRTNLLITDAGSRGTRVGLIASGATGPTGREDVEFEAPAGGQIQINDLASWLSLGGQKAALRFHTQRGQSIASLVSIDNRTNDPTLFSPDVAAGVARLIPIIGHLDGAQGSRFRTDLFLFNPSDQVRSVVLQTRPLDRSAPIAQQSITLLPRESKVIPDVYKTLFDRTGTGRLLFQSTNQFEGNGIRVSARIYSEREDGGTYGFVMPALNAFQSAGPGESIEILGSLIHSRFRTNLALVDPSWGGAATENQRVRVEIFGTGGQRLDNFEVQVPLGGGVQLSDLFTSRNLTAMLPTPVMIRISPSTAAVAAFATMIDNQTNDPLYLGAGLTAEH